MRRTRAHAKTDDYAFPIRLKFFVPPRGLGTDLDAVYIWLQERLPRSDYAVHTARTIGSEAMAVHFRSIEIANQFLEHFSHLPLADTCDRRSS